MVEYSYLIPLLPLASALIILFFGDWLPRKGAPLGIAAILGSWYMSVDLFMRYLDGSLKLPYESFLYSFFEVGNVDFQVGILIDGPSLILLLVVTTISAFIQLYSLEYMQEAPRLKRFYAYLSMFTFAMLLLVVSNNYLQFFVGWELMGVCSYLLISFEFEREAAATAGNKAFLTTRLGDLGFYAALLLIFSKIQTLNFGSIQAHLADGHISPQIAFWIALLLFCGTVGKSAQFPLHVWLPDAMEGPTPVSALIHAATMVAAGIFLIARSYAFFLAAPRAMEIVAWVGGGTALFAATIALTSNDIKKILAYSTISQLGYMVMALGLGGYSAGLFHLTTHAVFKALLFLGAGSVIHAVHTNDIWKMGSLSKQMILTFVTFTAATAAIAGIPPFAGYYSKDMILNVAYQTHHIALFVLGCVTAFMTSFYMMRAWTLLFIGTPRERDRFAHAHESGWFMTIPLMILGLLAVVIGFTMKHAGLVEKLFDMPGAFDGGESHFVSVIATTLSVLGILMARAVYNAPNLTPGRIASAFLPLHTLFVNKWYIDEIYEFLFVRPLFSLARGLSWFDYYVVDQFGVDGSGIGTRWLSLLKGWIGNNLFGFSAAPLGASGRRIIQTGYVQTYLFLIALGFLALFGWRIFSF